MTEQPAPAESAGEQAMLPVDVARAVVRTTPGPKATQPSVPASTDPVAQVLVDLPLAHLDRPFDYLITAAQDHEVVPGCRVKVRFAGRDVDGFVLSRAATSAHQGRLQPLRRVVSSEPVLTPEVAELSARIARRYVGTRSDVLRLAVPPRHARSEQATTTPASASPIPAGSDAAWAPYDAELLARLRAGEAARGVVSVAPGDRWPELLAEAVAACAQSGRGALVCVPGVRDLARLDAALRERLGEGRHVQLSADLGPAKRFAAFLAVARGHISIVIGTRAAAFAPVRDLGLVAMWDDGDDLYYEPRAPYCHAREVLLERADATGCGVLLSAHARSVEAQYLVRTGWAQPMSRARTELRQRVRVSVTGDSDTDLQRDPLARQSRMPREVREVIGAALESGPVLIQTPRSGYATRLACDRCREPARCVSCAGPLQQPSAQQVLECAWCGTTVPEWACTHCGGHGLRAPVLGDARTAEELGRSFPGVLVRTSSGDRIVDSVPDRAAIVVSTPGAEPVSEPGYCAVVLLDTWSFLTRADLRAHEEAVRRWSNAAALARPGARVLLVGEPAHPALQAMVRWDPAGFAEREILERQSAHLPPASRVASVTGEAEVVAAALTGVALPQGTELLGPVAVAGEDVRYIVRTPRALGADLSAALRELQGQRSARKLPHLRIEVDPAELG